MQLKAINTFIYTNIDKTVFMDIFSKYGKNSKVLYLNKVFYGLQQFPLLWQQKLTNELKKLGFKKLFQNPYMIQKNSIISFFYIDDIVFAFKKGQNNKVD